MPGAPKQARAVVCVIGNNSHPVFISLCSIAHLQYCLRSGAPGILCERYGWALRGRAKKGRGTWLAVDSGNPTDGGEEQQEHAEKEKQHRLFGRPLRTSHEKRQATSTRPNKAKPSLTVSKKDVSRISQLLFWQGTPGTRWQREAVLSWQDVRLWGSWTQLLTPASSREDPAGPQHAACR